MIALELLATVVFIALVALLALWASGSLHRDAQEVLGLTEEEAQRNAAPLTSSIVSVTPQKPN